MRRTAERAAREADIAKRAASHRRSSTMAGILQRRRMRNIERDTRGRKLA